MALINVSPIWTLEKNVVEAIYFIYIGLALMYIQGRLYMSMFNKINDLSKQCVICIILLSNLQHDKLRYRKLFTSNVFFLTFSPFALVSLLL